MFFEPGSATERALAVVYELLEMTPPPQVGAPAGQPMGIPWRAATCLATRADSRGDKS